MSFITNNLEWAPSSIADLYKSRWVAEVFFKEIKQTLQLFYFLGHNKNAVLWHVWMALLLLRYLCFVHYSFKRLFCVLGSCIWEGFFLRVLLKSCGTASGGIAIAGAPQRAWLPDFEPI